MFSPFSYSPTASCSARRFGLRVAAVLLLAAVLSVGWSAGVVPAAAQSKSAYIPPREICVLKKAPFRGHISVPPPVAPVQQKSGGSADFQFIYNGGWPEQAKTALEFAADIWTSLLDSPSPIVVFANWNDIGGNTLGFAGPRVYRRDFNRAPKSNTFYPIAMANAVAGTDLNGGQGEINLTLNSSTNWYFGTDGNVPSSQFSLVSVALHELTHGLGFTGSANVNIAGEGSWGIDAGPDDEPVPTTYDTFVEDHTDTLMINETKYPNPSMELGDILTAGGAVNIGLFFDGSQSDEYKLFTPINWNQGSSYSHFANSSELMSPATPPGASNQDPGHALDVLMDSGWDDALPVELTGFKGVADEGDVVLSWRTLTETNNDHFRILQKKEGGFVQVGTEPSRVEGGTTSEPQNYAFRINGVAPGSHTFRLEQVDIDGTEHLGDVTTVEVALDGAFHLSSAYPNPFHTRTRLNLTVKDAQEVRVIVYDALGRRVAVPFEGVLSAEEPQAVMLKGSGLASGLYLVRVKGEDFTTTRTVTLVQ